MAILITLGVLVCFALLAYIFKTLRSMNAVKAERAAQEAEVAQKALEQQEYLSDSIRVIANAMLHDERMTLSEGTIRISELLDRLAPELKQRPELKIIGEVHDQIRDVPYLDAWKSLPKQKQFAFKKKMLKVEQENQADLELAAQSLKHFKLANYAH